MDYEQHFGVPSGVFLAEKQPIDMMTWIKEGDMIQKHFCCWSLKRQLFWFGNFFGIQIGMFWQAKVGQTRGYPLIVDAVFHILSYYKGWCYWSTVFLYKIKASLLPSLIAVFLFTLAKQSIWEGWGRRPSGHAKVGTNCFSKSRKFLDSKHQQLMVLWETNQPAQAQWEWCCFHQP